MIFIYLRIGTVGNALLRSKDDRVFKDIVGALDSTRPLPFSIVNDI
jgi:hypothetical protein